MDYNQLNYRKMKTKVIKNTNNKLNNTFKEIYEIIQSVILECYQKCAFSTLPYFTDKYNSLRSVNELNSGNCVSLSYFIKNKLKEYSVNSYIVPATIPKLYQKSGYLSISHVALAIPFDNKILLIDPAFYFFNPAVFYYEEGISEQIIKNINIYSNDKTDIIANYSITDSKILFNEYQSIPKNTPTISCNFVNDVYSNDIWHYYLREIKNPDEAISTFFINRNYKFITTTRLSNDGYCEIDIYLKIHKNDTNPTYNILEVKKSNIVYFNDYVSNLTNDNIKNINKLLKGFIKKDIRRYLFNKDQKLYLVND